MPRHLSHYYTCPTSSILPRELLYYLNNKALPQHRKQIIIFTLCPFLTFHDTNEQKFQYHYLSNDSIGKYSLDQESRKIAIPLANGEILISHFIIIREFRNGDLIRVRVDCTNQLHLSG